jgi:hypothetical protein
MAVFTLELPWVNNYKFVSRIPPRVYVVKKRFSMKHGRHFIIENVRDRDYILIHAGNYYGDTEGCILVGLGQMDIDGDKYIDLVRSRRAIRLLRKHLPRRFYLKITEDFNIYPYDGVK